MILSGLEVLNIKEDSTFVNVGERTNVTGSKKFLRLIEQKKYELTFYSGFTGYKQDKETFELEPVVSWFIGHKK